jgi:hypothetical protein
MNEKLLTIAIPTYNRAAILGGALCISCDRSLQQS